MWRKVFVSLGLTLLASASAQAQPQTGRIAGSVTSTDGAQPIENAQVVIPGTTIGTLTREDGRYSLTVAPGTYTVVVRRIGYLADSSANITVTAGGTATANFTLRQAAAQISGVTVIGYGTQEQRDRTGVIDEVSAEEFNTGRIVAPTELIRAKVPGVQVVDNNEPGGGMAIRVRGGTSVNASNEPLFVVDGVPLQVGGGTSAGRNPLNFLNPNDIQSMTVLKDASATAIYGSRGANGVVIITTKSGASGPQFAYNGSVSGSQVTGGPDLLNATQYRAAVQQFAPANAPLLGTANTDWLGEVEQNAGGQEHNLGVSGQREDLNYRLGLGFLDQKGVLRGTQLQRVSANFNYSDRMLTDRLGVRAHLNGSRTKDWFTPGGVLGNAIAFAPTQAMRNANGSFFEWTNTLGPNNPLGYLTLVRDQGTTMRSIGNVEGEYDLPWVSGLSFTTRAGYDVIQSRRTRFEPSTLRARIESGSGALINRDSPEQMNVVLDAYGTYEKRLGRFGTSVDITGGYSTERFRGDYSSFYAQNLATDLLGNGGIPASTDTRPFYTVEESRLVSGFGRINVGFFDRYMFTGTVRRDGSSKFGPLQQWGTFPSAAFAWRVIDEPMLRDKTPFSDLKLRVSWGKNGNQAFGNYLAFSSYTVGSSTAQVQFGDQFVTTIRPSAADPSLKWEETSSTNVGVDYGFFNDRITGAVDWYTKDTKDLIFNVPVAAGTNLSNFVTTNIGSLRNRGLEFGINARVIDGGSGGGFTWDANLNASTNKNEILTINPRGGSQRIRVGGIAGGVGSTVQVLQPGQPINSFFVYQHKMENGKPVWRDVNSSGAIDEQDLYVDQNNDKTINQSDLRPFKDPAPKWIIGHSSNVSWRGFDASTTLRMYTGNYVYNNLASNLGNYSVIQLNGAPTSLHASVLRNGFVAPQYLSDVYIEDASFIRMDNLTVGYTFARVRNLRGLRLFGTVQNVFTSTDYSGVDPTAGLNGIDNNIYPRSRTFVGGLSVGF